ncbi:MAG: SapC family protein [Betaproteobacteria bacterium]
MTTQMLIYERAIPVSIGRHGKCSVEVGKRYPFMRNINSVPLMAVEFPRAAVEYAIVFADSGDAVVPVVILGIRQDENVYLGADDAWQARYVPAFIRRYPFVFSASEDGRTCTLCIDEAFPGLNHLHRGQALFDEAGKPTSYVDNVLQFQQEYRAQFLRTEIFCRKLRTHDLLEPMRAQFTLESGEKLSLGGFMVIDRQKLKSLPAEVFGELARSDELELIYLHMQSMRNFAAVTDRLVLLRGGKLPAADKDFEGALQHGGRLSENTRLAEPSAAGRIL